MTRRAEYVAYDAGIEEARREAFAALRRVVYLLRCYEKLSNRMLESGDYYAAQRYNAKATAIAEAVRVALREDA